MGSVRLMVFNVETATDADADSRASADLRTQRRVGIARVGIACCMLHVRCCTLARCTLRGSLRVVRQGHIRMTRRGWRQPNGRLRSETERGTHRPEATVAWRLNYKGTNQ